MNTTDAESWQLFKSAFTFLFRSKVNGKLVGRHDSGAHRFRAHFNKYDPRACFRLYPGGVDKRKGIFIEYHTSTRIWRWSADHGGGSRLQASGNAHNWELFYLHWLDNNSAAFKSENNHFVCAEKWGKEDLNVTRTEAAEWETFRMIPYIAFADIPNWNHSYKKLTKAYNDFGSGKFNINNDTDKMVACVFAAMKKHKIEPGADAGDYKSFVLDLRNCFERKQS